MTKNELIEKITSIGGIHLSTNKYTIHFSINNEEYYMTRLSINKKNDSQSNNLKSIPIKSSFDKAGYSHLKYHCQYDLLIKDLLYSANNVSNEIHKYVYYDNNLLKRVPNCNNLPGCYFCSLRFADDCHDFIGRCYGNSYYDQCDKEIVEV